MPCLALAKAACEVRARRGLRGAWCNPATPRMSQHPPTLIGPCRSSSFQAKAKRGLSRKRRRTPHHSTLGSECTVCDDSIHCQKKTRENTGNLLETSISSSQACLSQQSGSSLNTSSNTRRIISSPSTVSLRISSDAILNHLCHQWGSRDFWQSAERGPASPTSALSADTTRAMRPSPPQLHLSTKLDEPPQHCVWLFYPVRCWRRQSAH